MPVYLIRAGNHGPVKIGVALDVPGRLIDLQCGNHEELHLIRQLTGSFALESWLHQHYAAQRVRGEWFRYSRCMLYVEPPSLADRERPDVLVRVLDAVGGPQRLAEHLGISRAAVSAWRRVPDIRVIKVEALTGGKVHRNEMRPDLYPVDLFPAEQSSVTQQINGGE